MNKLEILKNLVGIDSTEKGDEIFDYVKNVLSNKVKEIKTINNEVLFIGINTHLKDVNAIVLSGHIDTVKADCNLYSTNPYVLSEKEGKVYGLGVIDMKCFCASVIDNIEQLKVINSPLIAVFTSDEETKLKGIQTAIEYMKNNNIKPLYTIIGERTNMNIGVQSNGCNEYEIEAFGKSCHSSQINKGINSICVIAKLITYIEGLNKTVKETTLNCGIIKGGDIVNRVPDYAKLNFDLRTTNILEKEEILSKIENYIKKLMCKYNAKITIKNKLDIPSFKSKNTQFINFLTSKFKTNKINFAGGCEAGYFTQYCGDAIIYGVGDISLAHKPNEYMIKENYFIYNKNLISIIKEIERYY